MIVPRYWGEARAQHRDGRRQVTVRRFGWSDDSQAAADAHARERVDEAMARILAGELLPRRELRAAYGEGVPIREEIVEQCGDAVLTRNSYGALCLNTPDVLFADVDFEPVPEIGWRLLVRLPILLALLAIGHWLLDWAMLLVVPLSLLLVWAANRVVKAGNRRRYLAEGSPEQRARARIDAFAAAHPHWHLRLYRTPAGFRLLAMHATFDPSGGDVAACFEQLGVDPLFARMCRMQHCFRARVSPKPWRVGMRDKIKPRYAAWREEQRLRPERQAWIERYQRASAGHAACRYLATLGDASRSVAEARRIGDWHDALCRAEAAALPIA